MVDETNIGCIGILHPEVITNFNIGHAVTVCELNIERFV